MQVLVTMPFNEVQVKRLRAVSPEIDVRCEDAGTADYSRAEVLYAAAPPRDLTRATRLKWVQLHMAGVNAIHDHPLYTESSVPLTTASGVHAGTIAEYVLTAMLALCHRVPRMIEWQARGGWPPDEQRWPLFVPTEVRGAALGIIGYGSIGRELARMAKAAFGMRVLALKRDVGQRSDAGYSPPGMGDPEGLLPDAWFGAGQLDFVLEQSDVVVMCAPLTPETRRMLGTREFGRMKRSAYFVNVGRGATVDEYALAEALIARRLAGAAIDVFAQEPPPAGHPFYALDNVILSPHVSGFYAGYDDGCSILFAENLRRYLTGAPLLNLVDRARGY